MKIEGRKRTVILAVLVTALLVVSLIAGTSMGYQVGKKAGYSQALTDVTERTGILFEWTDLGDGTYEIKAFFEGSLLAVGHAEFHCEVIHRDVYGNLIDYTYHAGTLTTIGKNWIEDQLGDSPSTDPAKWISNSNTTQTPNATWTTNYGELDEDGLARAAGTYASTGDGTWNQTKTFSVTGSNSTVCYGLHWAVSGDNKLLCAENQGAGNRKNVNSGDTLKVTWQVTVT